MSNNRLVHIVSFSGGRTSAFLVWLMERARKEFGWDVRYVFCDTGVEHPQCYTFIRNIVKFWGIDLVVLRAKVNPTLNYGNSYQEFKPNDLMNSKVMPPFEPFNSMLTKYGTPTVMGAYCSDRMKKDVTNSYCKDKFGKGNYVTWLGIRSDEPHRLKPKPGIKYLADLIDIDEQDVLNWWSHQPFDLGSDQWEGNCLFCVKKASTKIALAARQNPGFFNMWLYHLKKKTVREKDGFDKLVMYRGYLTLEGIAELYEGQTDAEILGRMRSKAETGLCGASCEAFDPDSRELNYDIVNQDIYKEFELEMRERQQELMLMF